MKNIISIIVTLLSICNIDASAYVKYVTTNLNLRYGPGTDYSVLAVIPQGTQVTIEEDCDCKWVPVEYQGKVGYISTKYLSESKPTISYTSKKTTSSHKRSLRSSSNRNYKFGSGRYYTNVDGYRVQSPTYSKRKPTGATALCWDGTYSYSRNSRGTCSHHGGVKRWL